MRDRTINSLAIAAFLTFLAVDGTFAQPNNRELLVGTPIERDLSYGERHAYPLYLESDQFLYVSVRERGIDAYLTLLDSTGAVVTEATDHGGSSGLQSLTLFSETPGLYWVAVLPRIDGPIQGEYTITLEKMEPVGSTIGERVDQLFAGWNRSGSPGAAVAVIRNGQLEHSRGYGFAQLEYGVPIRPNTVFHVASVSKQFTAFAAVLLEAQGRISLDDDVRSYVPELHDYGHQITIRHLLYHTSGLRDQWGLLTMAGWRMDDVITRDQILRLVERQRELNFVPGTEYLYSNTGFTLIAEIVERVTGQSFREWTSANIFQPLGMENTHFHDDHQELVPNRADSYVHDGNGGFKKAVLSYANVGATSLFTTVDDMARWVLNFETGEVGGPDAIRLLRSRGVLSSGDSLDYAMGQAIGSYRGLLALYHGGADAGFRSYLLRFPLERLSVIVLSNLASIDAGTLARETAALYLENRFVATNHGSMIQSTGTEEDSWIRPAGGSQPADSVSLSDYGGTFYADELGALYRLYASNDTLYASHLRLGTMPLHANGFDSFVTNQWFIREIAFERDEIGTVIGFRASNERVRGMWFRKQEGF